MTEINRLAKPAVGCGAYRSDSGTDQCIRADCRRCWPDAQAPEPSGTHPGIEVRVFLNGADPTSLVIHMGSDEMHHMAKLVGDMGGSEWRNLIQHQDGLRVEYRAVMLPDEIPE